MKRGIVLAILGGCLAAAALSACGRKVEEPLPIVKDTPTPTPRPTDTPTPAPVVAEPAEPALAAGQMYSYLTGLPLEEEIGKKRPFAVMINNLQPAVPQSGLSNAEILYEAKVEGNITRLMAVFQDPSSLSKIGPVRSSRHYYIDFARDHQAIYTHFGWSIFAQARIENEGLEHINGMEQDGGNFYRTEDREAPHNAYTSGEGLIACAQNAGYSRDYSEDYQSNFLFHKEDTPLTEGTDHTRVRIPFEWDMPYFEYHADDKQYYRFEYDEPHIDMENNEQLKFKNIIVQYASYSVISDHDHQDINLFTEGRGIYITDGKAVDISWRKADADDETRYYDASGKQLVMNPGKTMIEVLPDTETVTFE